MRPSRPFLIAIAILVLLHFYIGSRLLPDLALSLPGWIVGVSVLAASCLLMPLGMVTRSMGRQPLADRIAWGGMIMMGLFSSLLVLTLLRDIVLLIVVIFSPTKAATATYVSALLVVVLSATATIVGFVNARRRARIVDVDIPIAHLPAGLQGFSIVQISDVHVGPTIKRGYVDAIVDAANGLDADVIAITGDLVDGTVPQLAADVQPLQRLNARHGVYFVTGNHEYYSGEPAWTRELRRLGLRVLANEHVVVARGEAALVLAGVTDYGAHHFDPQQRSDPAAALAGAPVNAAVRILLAHQPRTAPAAASAGFDLQLSGHTHGGQFWPWNLFVPLQQPFTAGLHRLNRLWVYVSRGTGYWGPPKRFGAPSEITRIRLVAG
ncbi:MAG TPA: metallophosphoesterase [Povalibacter sp.]|uniref:metallophosphoesterase n=1 Tax=Povalibacter sp. TaxID=1962978 RepID=UPI002BAC0F3C|nr:metallophosphoesterase [Povalibacter sp.]HMN46812.1 metallophosphoesterase [Povalibacter sp.]